MERIVIEVADATAKKWEEISPALKVHLQNSFAEQIENLSQKEKEQNFEKLLERARAEAAANGLTEEKLQELLNED